MHRQPLLKLLAAYNPVAPEEQAYKTRMIAFIDEHEDCFERTLAIGHITASAWLISKDGSKALLLHHRKLNKWLQLGGHCDGNPDTRAGAIKEAQEESGILGIEPVNVTIFDIDIHRIPEYAAVAAHDHYDVRFLLRVTSNEQVVQNHESKGLIWVGKEPLEVPTDEPSVVRMFTKWLEV